MARKFNGSTDHIIIDGAQREGQIQDWFSVQMTVGGWIKGAAQNNTGLYSEGSTSSVWWWLSCSSNAPNNRVRWNGGTNVPDLQTTGIVLDGTWHHFMFCVGKADNDGSNPISQRFWFYIDGALDSTSTIGSTQGGTTTNSATFGALRRGGAASNFFTGQLSDWGIWDRALNAGEVSSIFTGSPIEKFNPLHYYPMMSNGPEFDRGRDVRITGSPQGAGAPLTGDVPTRKKIYVPSLWVIERAPILRPTPPPSTAKSDSDSATLAESENINGATVLTDSDHHSLADLPSIAASLSDTASPSMAEGVPSIGNSATQAVAFTETTANAISVGPTPTDSEIFILSSTAALDVAVSASETFAFAEDPPAVNTPNHLALQDADTGTLSELGTNASGGIGNSFLGVVLAFDDDALAASPTWTRLDDPHGAS